MSNEHSEFPQERVVPGRPESPTQSGSVPGTPILKAAYRTIDKEIAEAKRAKCHNRKYGFKIEAAYWAGVQFGLRRSASIVRYEIRESNNTARSKEAE